MTLSAALGSVGSRVLVVYVAFGLVMSAALGEFPRAVANLVLLLGYAWLIVLMTRHAQVLALPRDTRGRRALVQMLVIFAVYVAYLAWAWADRPLAPLLRTFAVTLRTAGVPESLIGPLANAVDSAIGLLLPAVVVIFLLFRISPASIGLAPRSLGLGVALVGVGVVLAGISKLVGSGTTPLFADGIAPGIALFAASVVINALPEELVFRGALQSRAQALSTDVAVAIVAASMLFVASHLPAYVATHAGGVSPVVVLSMFGPGVQPTGLLWGLLFVRTGSIWPGVLMHASFTTLGVVFI